ncbi:hypothetical protein CDD81_3178 [Ophiocordyceps australis]|uniref:Potassium transport protein n=1 Tax=Ophiocordyceps australis TaxID=1399860 RepID=A0A2C5XE94_9HYPO|nr:hypothetical protein CDD81_3178 [Ophiocordyceps australis]
MWRPRLNFVTIHYAYIVFMGIMALPVLYPAGNLSAVDSYFFGVSASTESGLNTVDVKELKTYQQLFLYFVPTLTNLGFINAVAVLVRFLWFRKHIQHTAPRLLRVLRANSSAHHAHGDLELGNERRPGKDEAQGHGKEKQGAEPEPESLLKPHGGETTDESILTPSPDAHDVADHSRTIAFDDSANRHPKKDATLFIPSPQDRERGHPLIEVNSNNKHETRDDVSVPDASRPSTPGNHGLRRRHHHIEGPRLREARTLTRVASSMFVLGSRPAPRRANSMPAAPLAMSRPSMDRRQSTRDMLALSRQATLGRNSTFYNLTREDREKLGGIEYRSLKLLLKIVFAYFFGLHIFGAICLVGWIQHANPKYKEVIRASGQNTNWWAFYSAQTMVNNLGFTLTPDSMISFRDAEWPMFIMSVLSLAGNTLYPVLLRLLIWTTSKIAPKNSSLQEPLSFLLDHPRRCYTLLFPSRPTWALAGIIGGLNTIDTLLILLLDLKNPEVSALKPGRRILAAIFQAVSARHTGTSTFNLSNVSPAVQFSLLIMMYIAVFPIAMSIRSSNTYEEKSLGVYEPVASVDDESDDRAYHLSHIRNQLSFDLWYIFLGIFCICIAEADRIADREEWAFSVWTVFFEVTSAYGNVGLSLGYPTVATSLSGELNTFSKLIICAMMIRGRHRGLPYSLDRAIMLPNEHLLHDSGDVNEERGPCP